MYALSYIQSALHIIENYRGDVPFAAWIKDYFRNNKKFGSRDRKHIAHLCYCFYRLGKAFTTIDNKQRMIIALFLCSSQPNKLLEQLNSQWNTLASKSIQEKCLLLGSEEEWPAIFPWHKKLSDDIDARAFAFSFLIQPDLFLRIRPGKEKMVKQKLQQAEIPFHDCNQNCIALPNNTNIENWLQIDKEVVVQDRSSQQTLNLLFKHLLPEKESQQVWDCCAASGGKSILLKDKVPDIKLIVSDIRVSILINLKKRFEQSEIKSYTSFVADLYSGKVPLKQKVDVVICDAPCTGSGTWSRTPEQNIFFDEERIYEYAEKQKRILKTIVKYLKPGGCLVYITCSVFRQENEEVVQFIKYDLGLTVIGIQYLKGYTEKADTLFSALFQLS